MPLDVLKGLNLVHVVLACVGAVGYFVFWRRTRFWLPTYAHWLAALALAVSLWCFASIPPKAPINTQGPLAKLLLILALPAIVYIAFVFYGGQHAAFQRQRAAEVNCPRCGAPAVAASGYATASCSHCGQLLNGPG